MSEENIARTGSGNAKLERFIETVRAEAEKRRDEILAQTKALTDEKIAQERDKIEREISTYLFEEQEKLDARYKQTLSKVNFDGRRMLLTKHEDVIKSVFDAVRTKLSEYTKSEEYKAYVIERVKAAKADMGAGNVTITLRPDDKALADEVKAAWGDGAEIKLSGAVENGGFMIASLEKQIVVDETFDKKLIEAQSDFVKTSGLYFG
ncbi:MAG: V-type ATP synthase subunit E [Clostridia bacterium]|nr:V-type ATP synthase subunit E [Clostridia bacterium]